MELYLDGCWQETAEVIDGVLGGGHLTQVILPYVGFDGAPGEGLARYMNHFALRGDPGVGDGWDEEAHVGSAAPEAAGKVMREEESVMAAFVCEQGDSRLGAGPGGVYAGLEPAAEFESVKLGLVDYQPQELFAIHGTYPSLCIGRWFRDGENASDLDERISWAFCWWLTQNGGGFPFFGSTGRGLAVSMQSCSGLSREVYCL
jgi:hypothetical protein